MHRLFYPFYQANFCAECGNRIEPRPRFRPRYFCDDCAARLNQRKLMTPLAGLLLVVSLAVFAFSSKRGRAPVQQLSPANSAPSVSAQDSIVNRNPPPQAQSPARVFCGARTRRGTPCRHLVPSGQRCAQHRGMPSMLDR
jgi:hypothetical protein